MEQASLPFSSASHELPGQTLNLGPLFEIVPPSDVTNRLELTQRGLPVEGVSRSLLASVQRSQWFAIGGGRIYLELRNPSALTPEAQKGAKTIEGVDFDDCLVSATKWHAREQQLMQDRFGVPLAVGKALYEAAKVKVPGKVAQEPRYTPRLNLAYLTAYVGLLSGGKSEEGADEEMPGWTQSVAELIQQHGEIAIARQAVDPAILETFRRNHVSRFLYRGFANLLFDPRDPESFRFIATRGKIEGPLGQVYKVHTSTVMRRGVDLVIYTNDLKAETLVHLGLILPRQLRNRKFLLFDDNCTEIEPYLKQASELGVDLSAVQVSHRDAKRKDDRIALEPYKILGRDGIDDTVLRYYSIKPQRLSRGALFQR